MGDTLSEFTALMEEFGTSVLQPSAVIGIAVMVILFILEVRWSRAHPPRNRRVEKAMALAHDMNPLRAWWEENRELSERFYREVLGMEGDAPRTCELIPSYNKCTAACPSTPVFNISPQACIAKGRPNSTTNG